MHRDLEALLRGTAVGPAEPLDPRALVSRARRRRRVRQAAAAGGAAVVVLATALVLLPGGDEGVVFEPGPTETTEATPTGSGTEAATPPVTDPSASPSPTDAGATPEPTASATASPTASPTAPTTEEPDEGRGRVETLTPVALADTGRPFLVAGPDGVRRVDGDVVEDVWSEGSAREAVPDLRGGVVLQAGGTQEGLPVVEAILWLPEGGGGAEQLAAAAERPWLHTVAEIDGAPTALYTRRSGEGEQEVETLYAYDLSARAERTLGVTGGMTSGLEGIAAFEDGYVVSICHLQCSLRFVPWGADPGGEEVVEVEPATFKDGLDVAEGLMAYVEPPSFEAERTDSVLVLRDVAGEVRVEIPLPTLDVRSAVGADVDLWWDASAALVRLVWYDGQASRSVTLLVEDYDEQGRGARVQRLDTDASVRFDTP